MKSSWVLAIVASLGWQSVYAATKVYNFTISSQTIAPGTVCYIEYIMQLLHSKLTKLSQMDIQELV
jgi:hypothetical protein